MGLLCELWTAASPPNGQTPALRLRAMRVPRCRSLSSQSGRRFARPPIRSRVRSLICEQRVPIAVPAPYTTGDGVRLSPSFVVIVAVVVARDAPAARGSARRPRDARQPRSTTARRRAVGLRRVGCDTTARRHSDPGRQHATTRRHDGATRRRITEQRV